jgi:predicted porin
MKKTFVIIAALATVGAAFAQSSVTLYGRIDASIGSQRTTVGGATRAAVAATGPAVVAADGTVGPTTKATAYGDKGTQILAGQHTGNRWGMRGTEDLGGGLKANFTLESGFSVDDGSSGQGGLLFGRTAKVGLSGGFGSIDVGRQYDIVDTMYANYDALGSSGYSANGALAGNGDAAHNGAVGDTIIRQNNAVIYSTPSMGGLSAAAMWAPGENKAAGASAGSNYGLMVNYGNGPFAIGGGYQSNKATGATAATTHYILGASYDLGVAKLFAQYDAGKAKSVVAAGGKYEDKGYSLGVSVPVGAARLQAAWAKEDTDDRFGTKVQKNTAFGLMAQYDLSKRTYVYAAYRNLQTDPTGAANTIKTVNYGLGLVHNF